MAYAIAKGDNLKKKKILLIHTHLVDWTKKFNKEVRPKNFEIIHKYSILKQTKILQNLDNN